MTDDRLTYPMTLKIERLVKFVLEHGCDGEKDILHTALEVEAWLDQIDHDDQTVAEQMVRDLYDEDFQRRGIEKFFSWLKDEGKDQ